MAQPLGSRRVVALVVSLSHLVLFAVPAVRAWQSSLDETAVLPLWGLAIGLLLGITMLFVRGWRRAGATVVLTMCGAAVVETVLAFALVVAYSDANPGWDSS